MSNIVRLASLSTFSAVDGPGLRTVIWFQGCLHHCMGCHNPQTHDVDGGYVVEINELLDQIRSFKHKKITISGGDPFLQNQSLHDICTVLKAEGYTIWIYTGYEIESLVRDTINLSILNNSDVLVDGTFIQELSDVNCRFKGSLNQRVIDLKKYLNGVCIEDSIILSNV